MMKIDRLIIVRFQREPGDRWEPGILVLMEQSHNEFILSQSGERIEEVNNYRETGELSLWIAPLLRGADEE